MTAAWTWTCLCCNVVGVGGPSHHCTRDERWQVLRSFWVQRMRWAMPHATVEEIGTFLEGPIERSTLADLLGERWLPSGDIQ